jgi:hypothetical protein
VERLPDTGIQNFVGILRGIIIGFKQTSISQPARYEVSEKRDSCLDATADQYGAPEKDFIWMPGSEIPKNNIEYLVSGLRGRHTMRAFGPQNHYILLLLVVAKNNVLIILQSGD